MDALTTGTAFVFAAAGVAGGLLLLSRFALPKKTRQARLDDSGSAAMEMVIVLPLFLTTIMVVVQCTHLMFATVLLEHAAFCVSRTASVHIGRDIDGEPPNEVWAEGQSHKLNKLSALANLLMAPMNRKYSGPGSGLLPGWDVSLDEYLRGAFVPEPETLYGRATVISDVLVRSAAGIAAQSSVFVKWRLNLSLARVEIRNNSEPPDGEYGEQGRNFSETAVLVVKVIYEYPLDVPAGGNVLGPLIGYVPDLGPSWLTEWFAKVTGIRHRVDITSTYHVVNWGQAEAPATP